MYNLQTSEHEWKSRYLVPCEIMILEDNVTITDGVVPEELLVTWGGCSSVIVFLKGLHQLTLH